MRFTALPVKVGDSFLLELDEFKVLVDGGMNQSYIVQLLNGKKIRNKHIDILICTHYDADHINGIIGLLKSRYTFDELWLPEIFGSLSKTVTENLDGLIEMYDERIREYEFHDVPFEEERNGEDREILDDDSFESIDVNLLENIFEKFFHCRSLTQFRYWPPRSNWLSNHPKMEMNLIKIANLVAKSINSGSYIRWFRYTGKHSSRLIAKCFYAENSIQTSCSKYHPELFYQMLFLTTINRNSLVFKYSDKETPNVLFTSDSDLAFVNNEINLNNNSVVTAPHHGSTENDLAYSKIDGNNLIYVRSDRSQLKRPGTGYINLKEKYCTICRNKGLKQEVSIEYTVAGIKKPSKKCTCK